MADKERLVKLLEIFTRLVEVERKKIRLAYDRLIELSAEIERVTDHLDTADTSLNESVDSLDTSVSELQAALFGDPEEEVEETEGGFEDPATDEETVVEIDEVGGDYEVATVEIPISGP